MKDAVRNRTTPVYVSGAMMTDPAPQTTNLTSSTNIDPWKRDGPKKLVWFSCGAASACVAKLALELYPSRQVEVIYCDTSDSEHPDNLRFLQDVEKWIQHPVKILKSKRFSNIDEVFERKKFLSSRFGAPCTVEMKKRVRFDYQLPMDIHLFGMTIEERSRIDKFINGNPELYLQWLLVEHGMNKDKCLKMIEKAGIEIPVMYKLGYRNNNCIGCVKATSPAYWNKVRKDFPEVFKKRVQQSLDVNNKLVRVDGKMISLSLLQGDNLEDFDEDLSCGPQCSSEVLMEEQ